MTDHPIVKRRGPDRKLWYVVAQAHDMASAAIPAGLLRSAAIPVYLFREAASSVIPVSFGMLGGVEVAVPEAYYDEATALLASDDETRDALPPPRVAHPNHGDDGTDEPDFP